VEEPVAGAEGVVTYQPDKPVLRLGALTFNTERRSMVAPVFS